MLAGNFYKMSKRGAKRGSIDAPKLSAGGSGTGGGRGRGRGRGAGLPKPTTSKPREVQPPPRSRPVNFAESDEESDKENVPVDPDMDVPDQDQEEDGDFAGNEQQEEQEEGPETPDEIEWRYKLIDIVQQYPEIYDLAHPLYKDRAAKASAWEEIATGMNATGESKIGTFINVF